MYPTGSEIFSNTKVVAGTGAGEHDAISNVKVIKMNIDLFICGSL
jgi:hypothetical protein